MYLDLSTGSMLVSVAAISSVLLGSIALVRSSGSTSHRLFAAGMFLITAETVLGGGALIWGPSLDEIYWFRFKTGVSALIPGIWLMFTLVLGQKNLRQRVKKWKWAIAVVFSLPVLFGVFFSKSVFTGERYISESGETILRLGWAGYSFYLTFILTIVLFMVLLENTLRASRGIKRWQIKFLLLGILGYFSVRVYSSSQVILFRSLDIGMETTLAATALIIANVLITMTFIRAKVLPEEIYLSGEVIHRSLVLLMVGGYMVVTGLLAKLMTIIGGPLSYQILSLLVFVALLLLAAFLLSDRLRVILRGQVSRHFKRPRYDYRDTWIKFTRRTASSENIHELCSRAASLISEMLEVLSVGIWLFDERKIDLILSGSTSQSKSPLGEDIASDAIGSLKEFLIERKTPFDFYDETDPALREYGARHAEFLQTVRMRYCVPLWTGEEILGFIALDRRVRGEPLGVEEFDLLRTIGVQTAAGIWNMILSERLQVSREMEALSKFSAFFVHDLKNLASKLSLMLQNFPDHYDNPDFREDTLHLIAQSVDKINLMTSRISGLREDTEISSKTVELSKVVRDCVSDFNPPPGVSINGEYDVIQSATFDANKISKVVTNLVLNAVESINGEGSIRVRTFEQRDWVVIEVADDGLGMDEQFITHSLFRPFKTTKENGLGIGLYQCRTIVEAHGGTISVSSKPGKGSTFQVLLPMTERFVNK